MPSSCVLTRARVCSNHLLWEMNNDQGPRFGSSALGFKSICYFMSVYPWLNYYILDSSKSSTSVLSFKGKKQLYELTLTMRGKLNDLLK